MRERRANGGFDVRRGRAAAATDAGDDHGLVQRHWVIGIAGRQTLLPPNGSARDIAGICNAAGNVFGLMPHPEHAIDPLTGPSADGLGFFTSVVNALGRVRLEARA